MQKEYSKYYLLWKSVITVANTIGMYLNIHIKITDSYYLKIIKSIEHVFGRSVIITLN